MYPAFCDRPHSLLCSNWRSICRRNGRSMHGNNPLRKASKVPAYLRTPIAAKNIYPNNRILFHAHSTFITCCSIYLPLRSDYPIVPSQLREAHVEPLLATLALYRAAALDRPSPHALHSRRIGKHD